MLRLRPLGKGLVTSDLRSRLQLALGANYVVERELPRGGMSRLFLAIEPALERTVVIKLLPPELSSEVSAERFRREMLVTARLQHPHILTVLHAGFADGLLFYVAPFVSGESLRSLILREPKVPIDDGIRIVRELADALACAHGAGIIHRDVKPENVLLEHGHAVLADFGVARAIEQAAVGKALTGTDLRIGTPGYMSPEQLAGDTPIDERADIYALGVIAFEIFAGQPPFAGRSAQAMVAAHLSELPTSLRRLRPEVPIGLAALITSMLAKNASDRPSNAKQIAIILGEISSRDARDAGRSRATRRLLLSILTLALIGLLGRRVMESWPATSARRSATVASLDSELTGRANSLAVMPFVNLSGDPHNDYFSDGMTEELINALTRVDGLSVAARNSSFAMKAMQGDVGTIGKKLHVRTVVEGSVRNRGGDCA